MQAEIDKQPMIFQRLASMNIGPEQVPEWIQSLSEGEREAIAGDRNLWRLPYQREPKGDWRRWIFRAGRGTGKTHTGSDETNAVAESPEKMGRGGEIGIIGRTHGDARYTMVEGPSGILATAPPDKRPVWEPGNGILTWPFKDAAGQLVRGRIYSADKPEQMRGPNFSWIWADEPAHWPNFKKTWQEVIELALRKGWARAMLTTTPIPSSFLQELEAMEGSVVTRASTYDNGYLSKEVLGAFHQLYAGTRAGDQELAGDYLEDNERALWKPEDFDQHRVTEAPDLQRIVVAVDPAVTANASSDDTGIVPCGLGADGHGYVLRDRTGKYKPSEWASVAVAEYHRLSADAIVAEVNNGGDLVALNIHGIDPNVKVITVTATRGKIVRAEPVSALFERGRAHIVGHLRELEKQCTGWDPSKNDSPDRLDAMVWGLTELMLKDDGSAGPLSAYK